jgi:PAS domain S-box-containing protein
LGTRRRMSGFDAFTNDRILVIDDNVEIHNDFRKILARHNESSELASLSAQIFGEDNRDISVPVFQIDTATQGQEGVEKVRAAVKAGRPYALAFVDMRMPPGWDGLLTIKRIWELDPDIEVVICTAYTDRSWLEITEHLGSSIERLLIIKKPFEIIEVRQLASALSQRWSLRKQAQVRQDELEKMVNRAQAERIESERRARAIINATSDSVLLLDADGWILDINEVGAETLGGTPQSLTGTNIFNVLSWATDASVQISEAIRTGRSIRFGHTHLTTIFDCQVFPVRDSVGVTSWAAFFFRDITEQQRDRQAMIQSSRMATVGLLAASVAHEINNPLTYVLYNIEHLANQLSTLANTSERTGFSGGDPAAQETDEEPGPQLQNAEPADLNELAQMAREALDGANRVRNIVKDLRSVSHVDEGRLAPSKVDRSIEAAINMSFKEIKYRARLVKDYSPTPIVEANAGHLAQVILNLLINAAHAIPEGDVEHNEIRIRTWSEQGEVFVEVRDTGVGIRPEHMEWLFDPFFTTKDVGSGSGLGLSISHRLISSMGGRIEVESELNKGSCFTVRLPAARKKTADQPVTPTTEPGKEPDTVPRGKILVVDDESTVGYAIGRILSSQHEVTVLTSGEEARQVLTEDASFDLILCDMMMPQFSGMDLYDWLLSANPDMGSRLVFMTGGAFTPKATEYLERVSNLHVEKPFDVANLKKLVNELILSFRSKKNSSNPVFAPF